MSAEDLDKVRRDSLIALRATYEIVMELGASASDLEGKVHDQPLLPVFRLALLEAFYWNTRQRDFQVGDW